IVEDGFDGDGDQLSYTMRWTVNGAPFGGTRTTVWPGDTVPHEATAIDDVWECTAAITDGVDFGPEVSAETLIIRWSGPRTFTTCGATGRNGHTLADCDAAYAGSTIDEDEFSVEKGIQVWTAPATGVYRIEAWGARGGGTASAA